jgi:hypothetical protein
MTRRRGQSFLLQCSMNVRRDGLSPFTFDKQRDRHGTKPCHPHPEVLARLANAFTGDRYE